jgi:hypothetical protein
MVFLQPIPNIGFYIYSSFVLFAKYNKNNQVEEDEKGGACSTNGGEEERV